MEFSEEQIERYSRQIVLPLVGGRGQKKLLQAKVLLIGAGGLGSPAALYLAGAGVGRMGLVDSDVVDISNLQRQVLHRTRDRGRLKLQRNPACPVCGDHPTVTHLIDYEEFCGVRAVGR